MSQPAAGDPIPHRPVLYNEIIHALQPSRDGFYVDGTLGAGGHAWGILQASSGTDLTVGGRLLGLDLDPQALELARERLAPFGSRAIIVQASYTSLREQLTRLGWPAVHGVLLDLGVSSMQLDTPERGFSFQTDAPLDMRFSPENPTTAADLVNQLPERELADLIYRYGEERKSRQVAQAIVKARPLYTTRQLVEVVTRAAGGAGRPQKASGRRRTSSGGGKSADRYGLHPATRTFQALRIAVNRELEAVETVLPQAVEALDPGGRLAVISFHSLEDRIVKQYFRRESQDCICPPRQPVCTCGHKAVIKEITRSPIQASDEEIDQNPRSRSARLRVAEKL